MNYNKFTQNYFIIISYKYWGPMNKKLKFYLLSSITIGFILLTISLFDTSKESRVFLFYSIPKLFLLIVHLFLILVYIIFYKKNLQNPLLFTKYLNFISKEKNKNLIILIFLLILFLFLFQLLNINQFTYLFLKAIFVIIFILYCYSMLILISFKFSETDLKKLINFIFLFLLLLIPISMGLNRAKTIDFFAINGDFQTYNGIRRFLDYQIPYKDFTYYLGFGPLFITSLLQILIGNNFQMSLFATTFLSYLFSIISTLFIFKLVTKKWNISLITTFFIFLIFQYQILIKKVSEIYFPKLFPYFTNLYKTSLPSYSYRPARVFIVILFAIFLYLNLSKETKIIKIYNKLSFFQKSIFLGFIASPLIIWSNDFGIASFISFSFLFFITLLKKKDIKKIIIGTIIYSISSLISLFILINILTLGHFSNWFATTLQTSYYQSWYYGKNGQATFLFSDIEKTLTSLVLILLILWNSFLIYKNQKDFPINATILFMTSSYFIAGYMYEIFSGSAELFIFSNNFIHLILIAFIIKSISDYFSYYFDFEKFAPYIFIVLTIILFLSIGTPIYKSTFQKGIYNEQLHGILPEYGNELNTLIDYTNGAQVFSTYASAYETITDQFQPTRYDYIIHVLGDEARHEYLENFTQGNYPYVLTITEDYTYWEDWVWRANWFFYRELYQNYQPTYTVGYNNIWEPSSDNSLSTDNTTLTYEYLTPYQVLISINSTKKSDLIADVQLSYKTQFERKGLNPIRTLLFVNLDQPEKEVKGFNLPPESDQYFIPIEVENGYGSILLDLRPNEYGTININSIELVNLFEQSLNDIQPLEIVTQ